MRRRATLVIAACFCGFTAFPWGYAGAAAGSTAQGSAAPDGQSTRIVSLVPNLTELAFTIGAGQQVVGVSDFCSYPPEARTRPAVGGLVNPSLEGVLRLQPDVVLLYRSQQDFANRLTTLGVQTELFQVDALDELYAAIDRMGAITGETTAAGALTRQIQGDLSSIAAEARAAPDGPVPGLVIVSRDPAGLRAIYQASFLGQVFEIAGGKAAIPGSPAISIEDIIRANPRLIIDMSGSETAGASAAGATALKPQNHPGPWAALSTVPAVKNNHIYHWKNPHALLLGPSVVDTARQFQQLINKARSPAQ